MTVLYIDVSHHDWDRRGGNLDWARVRAATSEVMCARATYGDPSGWYRSSRYFADFQQGAAAAGFTLRGGYHNLIRGDAGSIARQVDWLRRELDAQGCVWAMADVEPYAELVSANMWPRFEDVQRFHDRWHAVDSRVLAWYIPRWFWARRDKAASLGEPDLRGLRGPLVQSHYAGGDGSAAQIYANAGGDRGTGWDDAYGGRLPDIWQYTAGADVNGASSNTDANAYRGSLDELRALLTGDVEMSWDERLPVPGSAVYPETGDQPTEAGTMLSWTNSRVVRLENNMIKALQELAELVARPPVQPAPVDPAVLRAAVAEALSDPAVLTAIARAVADEGHRRTAE